MTLLKRSLLSLMSAAALLTSTLVATPAQAETIYTAAEVHLHNKRSDCWTIVSAGVYNLTAFVARHEGGSSVIIGMCGVDATVGFLAQHLGENDPTRTLATYRIGALDPNTPPPPTTVFTVTQLREHAIATDCWSAVSGGVYNLTGWIAVHPGGAAVVTGMCGIDGTASFMSVHTGDANPISILEQFKIGIFDPTPPPIASKYTMQQVAAHNIATDCWSVVKNNVYNLSAWVNAHPGGAAVVTAMCGKDGTDSFVGYHGSAINPNSVLGQFQIGVLDTSVPPPVLPEYTLAQVASHNTAADCWSVVGSSVYNLTQWIALHPGGQAQIKAMCGLNSTASFNAQHSGSGTAIASLAPYKIGTFKAATVTTKYYTLTQVKAHKTRSNCWTIISGKVYNLTKWIAAHPGGSEAIIELCGRIGTEDFLDGHQGDKAAIAALAPYKIGVYKKSVTVVVKKYTLAQVATHKTASNCWSVVGSNVYNLTKWIALHPGGQAQIKAMCGVDASAGFNGQHSGSASAKASLAPYKIGAYLKSSAPKVVLKNYTAAQVSTHKTASNCWSIVSKRVYNLTKWIALHPGGQAQIKAMCGVDASAGFSGQHSGSSSALASLAKYRIGTLVGSSTPPAPVVTSYTLAQVKAHATATNCWSIAEGTVYSLTAWLRKQPAGSVTATSVCGTNATTFFKKKFGSSANTAAALKLYKIGKLK